jgi:hypothetical protein
MPKVAERVGGSTGGRPPADRRRGGGDHAGLEHDRVPADQERRPAALRVGKNYRIRESDVEVYLSDRSVQVEGA